MFFILNSLTNIILFLQTKPKVYPKRTIWERVWIYLGQAYDSVELSIKEIFSARNIAQAIKGIILMLIIILLSKLIHGLIRLIVRWWIAFREKKASVHEIQRAKTIGTLFSNISKYVLVVIATILILQGFNVDLTAIIASVGIMGIAIGFGAQSLIKDVISGFFILFEGDLAVGDGINLNDKFGVVEAIGVRSTKVRSSDGELLVIPNGDLSSFGNVNRGYMNAIVIISLTYESNFKSIFALIELLAQQFYLENAEVVMSKPDVQGIITFGTNSVDVRVIFKTKPMMHWSIERKFRLLIKEEFEKRQIEIPFPRQVIYYRKDSDAAPLS